jgi:DNA helicase-2/ATP-dependent DNA helicase PcrA
MTGKIFEAEYKKLNKAQKEAVDTIEGPVMVVAGPGTGKTQVLSLRIGNILNKTDVGADSILCLTFTNSGVRAMRSRLHDYIGAQGTKVNVSTFHSFALRYLIEKHYNLLDFKEEPKILSDEEAVFLCDQILHENDWNHIRPRTNPEMYFSELKQLISILKRERLSPEEFLKNVEEEILNIKDDPESISSRGESKGKLKKEIEKKIESFERTNEVVEFYRIYEEKKKEMSLVDYDDVLEYGVRLVEQYEDVRSDIRENYQYVLVDEHQDSSGVQNAFLKAVWREVEKPNIFVVGDDRQLIYGFSGASLSYFEEFSHIFKGTTIITLTENYRSTSPILSLADDLLKSNIAPKGLVSNIKGKAQVLLSEYTYQRDEIIGAGIYFKKLIDSGVKPEECALLVPRNHQVRSAIEILSGMGLPVAPSNNVSLFNIPSSISVMRILGIIVNPNDPVLLSQSLLDKTSGISPIEAHKFLRSVKPDRLSIDNLKMYGNGGENTLFGNAVIKWAETLERLIKDFSSEDIVKTISFVGNEFLIDRSESHEELLRNVEVVRTFIHIAELFREKKTKATLTGFLSYLKRLDSYGNQINLASFDFDSGIQVMTLHRSKGLEYKAVWIAHMNEEILMNEKQTPFTLPEKIKEHIKDRDILSAKRELYVAITRAKEHCSISYSRNDYNGRELELASIINELPEGHFKKASMIETEKEILSTGPKNYIPVSKKLESNNLEELLKFVKENYADTKVSVTLLNNFFECPWKWYFHNFLRLPEIKSLSLALGLAVHSVIEMILKNKSVPKAELIQDKLNEYILKEGIIASSVQIRKMVKDGEQAVNRFTRDFYGKISNDYKTERPLQFRDDVFPHLLMYGKLDLSEKVAYGKIAVTDFKTGSVKTKNTIEKLDEENRLSSNMRQLAMYSYLVAGAEKGTEVSLSRLFYLEALEGDKNMIYEIHIGDKEIDLLKKDIREYDKLLKTGEWIKRPCNYNSYGRNTECEYCKMAEIYKESESR